MFSEQFQHEIGSFLQKQAAALLDRQRTIATVYYSQKTGQLLSSVSHKPEINGLHVGIQYPLYIRFLDMKRGRGGKKKKGYEPIYNRYVYGYLYGAIYHKFKVTLHNIIVSTVKESIK